MRLTSVPRWWAALGVGALLALALLWAARSPAPAAATARPAPRTRGGAGPAPADALARLLPHRYWAHRRLYPESYADASCTSFPEAGALRYAAATWQALDVPNGTVYLFGAYWDDRFEEPLVRVLLYSDVTPLPALYCQLWYPFDNEPQAEAAEATYAWEPAWGGPTDGVNEPYVVACRARRHSPEPPLAPLAVTLVLRPCDRAGNALNVQNAPMSESVRSATEEWASPDEAPAPPAPEGGVSIGVCMKWLHYRSDVSAQLAEWLQLVRAFGADRAYLYGVRVHKNTERVLREYAVEGFAAVTHVSHAPQVSGAHWSRADRDFLDMRRELVTLNDCLYRNLRRHRWLAVFDLDEIIVPDRDGTWGALLERETREEASKEGGGAPFDSLTFPNYYVVTAAQRDRVAPPPAHMLAHTWRARDPSPPGCCVKSFVNTSSVVTMHNHMPLKCGGDAGWCRSRAAPAAAVARMLHFRDECPPDDSCACAAGALAPVRDDALRRWRPRVLAEVQALLDRLDIRIQPR